MVTIDTVISIKNEAAGLIRGAASPADLESLRLRFLGKKGELTSLMMAQLSGRHELFDVFNDLFDAGGATVQIHAMHRYEIPGGASYHDIVEILGSAGVSAIGYRQSGSGDVVLNPSRSVVPNLGPSDELIVIGSVG